MNGIVRRIGILKRWQSRVALSLVAVLGQVFNVFKVKQNKRYARPKFYSYLY